MVVWWNMFKNKYETIILSLKKVKRNFWFKQKE